MSTSQRVTQLMNSRRGKKGSITKRIAQIDRIVGDGGSRSQVTYLVEALAKVQGALQTVCDELVTLAPDTDSEWLDTENLRIDTCISEAKAYLERRRNDPPSTEGLAASWVLEHAANSNFGLAPEASVTGDDTMKAVIEGFSDLRTDEQRLLDTVSSHRSESNFLKPAHLSWASGTQQGVFVPSEQRFEQKIEQRLPLTYASLMDSLPTAPTFSVSANPQQFSVSGGGTRCTPSVSNGYGQRQPPSRP